MTEKIGIDISEGSVAEPDALAAEIGNFIIEFEATMQTTRDMVMNMCNYLGNPDRTSIELLMFDSTAQSLAKYFQAIAHHTLAIKHSEADKADRVAEVSRFVNRISNQLFEASTLRNDIAHASFSRSSFYGSESQLQARRPKVGSKGPTMEKFEITPGSLAPSIEMMRDCSIFMWDVCFSIVDDFLRTDHISHLMKFEKVNFNSERKKVFDEIKGHYKELYQLNNRTFDDSFDQSFA